MIGSRTGHFLRTRQKCSRLSSLTGGFDRDITGFERGVRWGGRENEKFGRKTGRSKRKKEKRELQRNAMYRLPPAVAVRACVRAYVHISLLKELTAPVRSLAARTVTCCYSLRFAQAVSVGVRSKV
jgi:hypothetical protein